MPASTGLQVFAHEDVIVLPHSCVYEAGSCNPAVHVSSKGSSSSHPAPVLQQQLPELGPAYVVHSQVWPQLKRMAACMIDAVSPALVPAEVRPEARLYHLFGVDCMVTASGQAVLLEVNSYPAIASGTMSVVPHDVYTRLIGDMVRLLVLPFLSTEKPPCGGCGCGGSSVVLAPDPGGFCACDGGGSVQH